jgi:hypothetical protein
MADFILELAPAVRDAAGTRYITRVHGAPDDIGRWHGWIAFTGSNGRILQTEQETVQPTRDDLVYWASGLEPVYLEGAFQRAREEPSSSLS